MLTEGIKSADQGLHTALPDTKNRLHTFVFQVEKGLSKFFHFHPMTVAAKDTTIICPSHLQNSIVLTTRSYFPLLSVKIVNMSSAHVRPRIWKRSIPLPIRAAYLQLTKLCLSVCLVTIFSSRVGIPSAKHTRCWRLIIFTTYDLVPRY